MDKIDVIHRIRKTVFETTKHACITDDLREKIYNEFKDYSFVVDIPGNPIVMYDKARAITESLFSAESFEEALEKFPEPRFSLLVSNITAMDAVKTALWIHDQCSSSLSNISYFSMSPTDGNYLSYFPSKIKDASVLESFIIEGVQEHVTNYVINFSVDNHLTREEMDKTIANLKEHTYIVPTLEGKSIIYYTEDICSIYPEVLRTSKEISENDVLLEDWLTIKYLV